MCRGTNTERSGQKRQRMKISKCQSSNSLEAVVHIKQVQFNENVSYQSCPRVEEQQKKALWYSESDTDKFFNKESLRKDPRKDEVTDARVFNTVRRVLFHYRTLKTMESGDDENMVSLRSVASGCSESDRQKAHHKAAKLHQEVLDSWVEKTRTLPPPPPAPSKAKVTSVKEHPKDSPETFDDYIELVLTMLGCDQDVHDKNTCSQVPLEIIVSQ